MFTVLKTKLRQKYNTMAYPKKVIPAQRVVIAILGYSPHPLSILDGLLLLQGRIMT